MNKVQINHLAVWIVAIVVMFIPPLWYDTVFFGIRWMELNEFKPEDFANFNMMQGYIMAFVTVLMAAYVMAYMFFKLDVNTGLNGMKYALLFWIGFRLIESSTQNMFSLRPFELTLIDESVILVQYQIIGVVLGVWKRPEKK